MGVSGGVREGGARSRVEGRSTNRLSDPQILLKHRRLTPEEIQEESLSSEEGKRYYIVGIAERQIQKRSMNYIDQPTPASGTSCRT